MSLSVFDNVQKALKMYNVERMKHLCRVKTTPVNKRRIEDCGRRITTT